MVAQFLGPTQVSLRARQPKRPNIATKGWGSLLLILKDRCVCSGKSCLHSLEPRRDLSPLGKICPCTGVAPESTDSGTQLKRKELRKVRHGSRSTTYRLAQP